MNKTAIFAAFVLGAASGAAGAWYYAKKRYEQIAQEEIDSVKESFGKLYGEKEEKNVIPIEEAQEKSRQNREKPSVADYAKELSKHGYTNYSNAETISEKTEEEQAEQDRILGPAPVETNENPQENPYVISPEHFDEFDDYDVISLMYYADGVLCDDNDEPIGDIANTVGDDAVLHFGEYDDDCVYVRNDRLKVDYEILRSLKTYKEVLDDKPYLRREV